MSNFPSFNLSMVQYTSLANSFKNNGTIYTGTINLSAGSVASAGTFSATSNVILTEAPQFSILYGYFQEAYDAIQQYTVGSGYNTAQWYQRPGADPAVEVTTAPYASMVAGAFYPSINGTTLTLTLMFNNPYAATVSYKALSIPYAFIVYTMTN